MKRVGLCLGAFWPAPEPELAVPEVVEALLRDEPEIVWRVRVMCRRLEPVDLERDGWSGGM